VLIPRSSKVIVVPVGVRTFEMRVETRRQDQPDVDRFAEHRERVESTRSRALVVDVHPCSVVERDDERGRTVGGVEQRNGRLSEGVEAGRRSWQVTSPGLEDFITGVMVELPFAIAQIVGIDVVV